MQVTITPIATSRLRNSETSGALADLLTEQDRSLYGAYAHSIPAAAMRAWNLSRSRLFLEDSPDRLFLCEDLRGSAAWSPLPWDSRLFGFPAARLDWLVARGDYQEACQVKRELLSRLLRGCRDSGVKHFTARADAGDLSTIHSLQQAGFDLIDGIQTFGLCLTGKNHFFKPPDETFQVGLFEPWQLQGVLEIARSAYQFDRFHSDPALPKQLADRIHEEWLRNSCSGAAADAVFVVTTGRQVLGFVTLRLDRTMRELAGFRLATIVLVATASDWRGKGIGRMATQGALHWLSGQGIDHVQIGTQLSNTAAARLYEGCGFRLLAASLTFRKLLDWPCEASQWR